jgi:hypothetical protein
VDTQGPLAVVWVGLGLACFYTALIWVNLLLGHLLTPLFIIPVTWILERFGIGRPRPDPAASAATTAR